MAVIVEGSYQFSNLNNNFSNINVAANLKPISIKKNIKNAEIE